ncbi:MAG: gamma-glutamyltransferase [Gammaproteobacteria bacterium]|nr:gamma-glutamyltransferase [Gammaproteobacteria bacterium]
MQRHVVEQWQIRKPAVGSRAGMVASQHHLASTVGADILKRGGNAIDAAIATGLALGTVEPWMSGIGGGGYMTVYLAREQRVRVVEFGMRAPFGASPDDYPLAGNGENAADAFNWPKVVGDANVEGPLSIAVPSYLRGIALALDQFGTRPFSELIDPACEFAEQGLPIDWFASAKINHFARPLARFEHTRQTFLADGLPPPSTWKAIFVTCPWEISALPIAACSRTAPMRSSRGRWPSQSHGISRQSAPA